MKKLIRTAIALITLVNLTMPVIAADNIVMLPIATAMTSNNAPYRLGDKVKYYFGTQATPPVSRKIINDQTNKKTNALNKTTEQACNWVFLSAMLQLKKRAENLGANAVINIVSNYDDVEKSSETEFECHINALMAGVVLKADFVKIDE
ncbi:excinuclease ATPase subunit [Undibacterium sp. TS12]|uniref:excinuclease ATPase subunit n=1 Tax=Undibacterium sp. TS12 TaxID=2908202 RepID=UPI001F4D267C|nr:excinuclease ATPase subunit [Undibacterium sp. TS12]MCH8620664.1 excinuclease ATPase subunit [Undibacterium sp. TS12]